MSTDGKYSKSLKIRVDPELYKLLKKEAKRHDTDVSTYIRWCIRTGLYLEDLNSFLISKSDDEDE